MQRIDVAAFHRNDRLAAGLSLHLIIKSLDQRNRRKRMIESKRRGTIGRIAPRPVAGGAWARVTLAGTDRLTAETVGFFRPFREPRGLVRVGRKLYLLAEISRVLLLPDDGHMLREFSHPYFGFLHSIDFDPLRGTFLAVSAGYDCLVEISLETGKVLWEWFTWEHGFTALDGKLLCRSAEQAARLQAAGQPALFVDPAVFGEQGLLTSHRANHPNSACYSPYAAGRILATLGHSGELIEIDRATGRFETRLSELQTMPHGILPFDGGWLITNTLRAEVWRLDREFRLQTVYELHNLDGKTAAAGEHEWLQATYPVGTHRFIGADANRGLVLFDVRTQEYTIIPCDPDWCVHHLLIENAVAD